MTKLQSVVDKNRVYFTHRSWFCRIMSPFQFHQHDSWDQIILFEQPWWKLKSVLFQKWATTEYCLQNQSVVDKTTDCSWQKQSVYFTVLCSCSQKPHYDAKYTLCTKKQSVYFTLSYAVVDKNRTMMQNTHYALRPILTKKKPVCWEVLEQNVYPIQCSNSSHRKIQGTWKKFGIFGWEKGWRYHHSHSYHHPCPTQISIRHWLW